MSKRLIEVQIAAEAVATGFVEVDWDEFQEWVEEDGKDWLESLDRGALHKSLVEFLRSDRSGGAEAIREAVEHPRAGFAVNWPADGKITYAKVVTP